MLETETRKEIWRRLAQAIEAYASGIGKARVTPQAEPEKIRSLLARFDFARPVDPLEMVDWIVGGLWQNQTHTPHPRYFGLFNPAPTTMGIAADFLVAAFNPQLAAWSHSPLAVEIEQHLLRAWGSRFGYHPATTDGTFTSGGAEANHTALLTALEQAVPEFRREGLRGLSAQPVLYVSSESHHSFLKAARLSGLGTTSVREIPVDDGLRMDVNLLSARVLRDRAEGFTPFLVVATAGSTSSGVVDPIRRLAELAEREGIWLHLDAAWGGAAALLPELQHLFEGAERADSITIDAHKWLSVPMGAGIYLTRHPDILERTFRIETPYVPRRAAGVVDPYERSMQWSRRFIGLKVFLSLAVAGWEGYATAIRHQVAMGERLRQKLRNSSWEVVNRTELPLVCFVDRSRPEGSSADYLEAIAGEVVSSGEAWISLTRLGNGRPALRACITNYRTGPEEVDALVQALEGARQRASEGSHPQRR